MPGPLRQHILVGINNLSGFRQSVADIEMFKARQVKAFRREG